MSKNIAILMGGYSSEYDISIKSGTVVFDTLSQLYSCYRVIISKTKWVCIDRNDNEHTINKGNFTTTIDGILITFDCVFNTVHGSPGEDGFIQAYFELIGIPQTSCDMYQAALTFNKRDLLSTLKPYNVPMAKSLYFNQGDDIDHIEIERQIGFPCFIKANRSGSSYGVSKVYNTSEIDNALDLAFKEDNQILIESFLDGTEVSVGVVSYKGEILVLPVTEIVSETDFFDYEAKYEGKSREITPARITEQQKNEVTHLAKQIYQTLGMKGFSRSDFIFHNGSAHFIEINTNPGLSEESILPQQAREAGLSLLDLFSNAVEDSLK